MTKPRARSQRIILRTKTALSPSLLEASVRFAIEACAQEQNGPPSIPMSREDPYHASTLASVVLAACFLESAVNELLLHAVHGDTVVYPTWERQDFDLMSEFWSQLEEQRAPTLRKVAVSLLVSRRKMFDKGSEPWQSADSLVQLRNALVHYKPEWNDELANHADLEARLRNKFPENPFASAGLVYFPHKCLGAGAARWACRTAGHFVIAFAGRLDAQTPLVKQSEAALVFLGAA
jgi:hypothetical protein